MLEGQILKSILQTNDGIVRLCNDTITNSYSIGLRIPKGVEWKYISEELYNLLVKELWNIKGFN